MATFTDGDNTHCHDFLNMSEEISRIWKCSEIFIMAETGRKQSSHGNLQTHAGYFIQLF